MHFTMHVQSEFFINVRGIYLINLKNVTEAATPDHENIVFFP